MLIVRKKTVIRFISFLFGSVLLIIGLFFRSISVENKRNTDRIKRLSSFYASISSSLDSICSSFDEKEIISDKDNAQQIVFSSCQSAKTSLYYCEADMPNTTSWFTNLAEYTQTEMSDPILNAYYAQTAKEARGLFVSLCNDVDNTAHKASIEKIFDKKDTKYYNGKLEEMTGSYPLLNNFLEIDRNNMNDHAKKILNFPISPQKTKGSFCDPPIFLYSGKNSYAQIFSSGGFVKRMSVEETSTVKYTTDKSFDELAVEYLNKYAPYAKNCRNVHCYKNTELIYYIYCPVITQNNTSFTDYTEPIKLAISISDGKLMAFDASHYMKTHSAKEYPKKPLLQQPKNINHPITLSVISEDMIYTTNGYYYCIKYATKGNKTFYKTYDSENNSKYYCEKDFLLMSGII